VTVRYQGGELIVDALVAKANMPQRLLAINAEKADRILLEPPADSDYYTAAVRTIGRAPAILVMEGTTTFPPGQEGPHSLMLNTRVAVYVLEEDSDEQRLGRKLQRQSSAVVESLWDSPPAEQLADANGVVAWRIFPIESIPGPTFEPEGEGASWRQLFLWIFEVRRLEE
jgi:hypothetical protein